MENPVIIVSGLPRSGTSIMMRMLDAGGVPVLTDNVRQPDVDNPQGYYEYERVKKIKEDDSWLIDARGKAVKMVSMLLLDLPTKYQYRILFMRRNLEEILRSERKMLDRLGRPGNVPDEEMAILMNKHLDHIIGWLTGRENMNVHYINYNELLTDTKKLLEPIPAFLNRELDLKAMTSVVDLSLYRNRADNI